MEDNKLIGKSNEYDKMKKPKKPIWRYWWILAIVIILFSITDAPQLDDEHHVNNEKTIAADRELASLEERKERFSAFYDEVYKQLANLEELDEAIAELQRKNPSRLQAYMAFEGLPNLMEEGQRSLWVRIPYGFSEAQEATFMAINLELRTVYQYRKFAYNHFLKYLDKGSLKDATTSKEWLKSASASLNNVVLKLESMKLELEFLEEETQEDTKKEVLLPTEEATFPLEYEILYVEKGLRYDGGVYYFVLIEPVDISTTQFKEDIKELVRDITEKMGKKIAIEFYDDKDALVYGHMSIAGSAQDWKTIQNDSKKLNKLVSHNIASFSGELKTGFYYNTLYFFTYSDQVDRSPVGELADIIEFNP